MAQLEIIIEKEERLQHEREKTTPHQEGEKGRKIKRQEEKSTC